MATVTRAGKGKWKLRWTDGMGGRYERKFSAVKAAYAYAALYGDPVEAVYNEPEVGMSVKVLRGEAAGSTGKILSLRASTHPVYPRANSVAMVALPSGVVRVKVSDLELGA
jgi:hypothetical protein